MAIDRREVLGAFGVASASTLLWAFGCGQQLPPVRRAPQVSGEVRTWLHDAVARLAAAFPSVHALAVSRHRTTIAHDVLGPGAARARRDGVVLTVRDRDGAYREHVTFDLSADGVDAAVSALGATRRRRAVDFGRPPDVPAELPTLDDRELRHRVELLQRDATPSSRIIYAAALLDLDDATVWSVAPGRDLTQRLVRIRQTATRAAWNGHRPSLGEVERAWSGGLDDHALDASDLAAASAAALELMTPGSFDDGERTVVLDPSAAALLFDAIARGLLTATAARPPDATAPAAGDAQLASPTVTLIDDPTLAGAYGAFAFDDEGEPAAPLTLLAAGRVAARLADHASGGIGRGRRPGHLAAIEPAPSHLRLMPGSAEPRALYGDGFLLETGVAAVIDPAADRVRLACARARELKAGNPTGRVYADVELTGALTAVLAAIDAVASAPASFVGGGASAAGPSAGGLAGGASSPVEPLWRSISAPALRTRGTVRARRSRA